MSETEEKPKKMGGVLIMSHHYWGWGKTINEAKAEHRKAGGRLDHYLIYAIDTETELVGVDGLGAIHYVGNDLQLIHLVKPKALKAS